MNLAKALKPLLAVYMAYPMEIMPRHPAKMKMVLNIYSFCPVMGEMA